MSKKTPLVIVTWLDSVQTNGSWQHLSDFKKQKPVTVGTVGWLIQKDDQVVVLAQSIGWTDEDNAQSAGRKVIPRCCVQKIEKLQEVE